MKLLLLLCFAIFSHAASPKILGPYSVATNHSDDIKGEPDTRPDTWGLTGYQVHTFTFRPPAGYRVRILRVYGNVQGWIPGEPVTRCVGMLWGLQTTGPEGSARVTPAADNTLLYVQDATCGEPFRVPVDYDVRVGGLLEKDHILYSKVAVFMNETGRALHLEPSFNLVFQFEREK